MKERTESRLRALTKDPKFWLAIGIPVAAAGCWGLFKYLEQTTKSPELKKALGETAQEVIEDSEALGPNLKEGIIFPISESAAQKIQSLKRNLRRRIIGRIGQLAKIFGVPPGMQNLEDQITYISLIAGQKIKEVWEEQEKTIK